MYGTLTRFRWRAPARVNRAGRATGGHAEGVCVHPRLYYRDLATGTGPAAQSGCELTVRFEARLPNGRTMFGVAIDRNIVIASLRALTSIAGRTHHT